MSAVYQKETSRTYGLHHSWRVVVSVTRVLFISLQPSSAHGITIPFLNVQVAVFQNNHGNQRQHRLGCHIHPRCMSDIRIHVMLRDISRSRIEFRPRGYRDHGTGPEIQVRRIDRCVTDADPGNYRPC